MNRVRAHGKYVFWNFTQLKVSPSRQGSLSCQRMPLAPAGAVNGPIASGFQACEFLRFDLVNGLWWFWPVGFGRAVPCKLTRTGQPGSQADLEQRGCTSCFVKIGGVV